MILAFQKKKDSYFHAGHKFVEKSPNFAGFSRCFVRLPEGECCRYGMTAA
ncbi:MAG: hypothetical protein LBL94_08530 [Prevotellaceae bacterium]|nr:hypothetical protein [Prevotellaceae bacterium]